MQLLSRAMKARGAEGESLPPAFRSLEVLGAKLRYSQLALIAAGSGTGKSAVATTWALRSGVPTLYFSADSDRMTLGTRVGASITGLTTSEVEDTLKGPRAQQAWEKIGEATKHIGWVWDRGLSLDDIEKEVVTYGMVHGQYPALVVVDNLKNVYVDDPEAGNAARYDQIMDFLHGMAGQTGSAVLVLHHVTGAYEDGATPVPLSGLMEKTGKTPRLVLTLHRMRDIGLGVCIVKNSNGAADPSGNMKVTLPFIPEKMRFDDGSP